MDSTIATLGDFINLWKQTTNSEARECIRRTEIYAEEGEIDPNYKDLSFNRETVIKFAEHVQDYLRGRLHRMCTQSRYMDCLREGHTFLKEIHEKAVSYGIDVKLKDIDAPLSFSDLCAQLGAVRMDDEGRLTVGEEELQRVEGLAKSLEE